MRVVHEAQQRLLLGNLAKQAQRRQCDKEAIRGDRRTRGLNAVRKAPCWGSGSASKVSKHRRAQLVQTGKRQLHLGFDAGDLADSKTSGLPARISQKRGLARPSLSPDDQHPAAATSDLLQQAVQPLPLPRTAPEPRRAVDAHFAQA